MINVNMVANKWIAYLNLIMVQSAEHSQAHN